MKRNKFKPYVTKFLERLPHDIRFYLEGTWNDKLNDGLKDPKRFYQEELKDDLIRQKNKGSAFFFYLRPSPDGGWTYSFNDD